MAFFQTKAVLFNWFFITLRIMLRLQELELVQFRNYLQQKWVFNERIIGICGMNGAGKTNLLDAIYYLGFSRSYFSRTDAQNIQHGKVGMRLSGNYTLNNEPTTITCIIRENNRKELLVNEEMYKKMSEHIGKFPCVMIAPDDVDLITGSGEARRKMIDNILSQTDRNYLNQLIVYTRVLQQRNSFLKQAEDKGVDQTLLQILNEQLIKAGEIIFLTRLHFLAQFIPSVINRYTEIAGKSDGLNMQYESQLHETSFAELLATSISKDLILQRTTKGIHKDDISLQIEQYLFKSEASQGQRKSLLFALKLAEWEYIKVKVGFAPILLLDDVFEKLDENRMFQLLDRVCSNAYGQVFISDTHADRLQQKLNQTGIAFQLIEL